MSGGTASISSLSWKRFIFDYLGVASDILSYFNFSIYFFMSLMPSLSLIDVGETKDYFIGDVGLFDESTPREVSILM